MTGGPRWSRVEEIFLRACELPDDERTAFVADAVGDDVALGDEVRSLLAFETGSDERLADVVRRVGDELPPAEIPASPLTLDDLRVGQRFGAWQLVDLIEAGGMGAVYLAERADATFEKRAALKLIKADRSSAEVRHWFQRERQALASLEHPNIARLLDGGTSVAGQPFLVMEYVDGGAPIDAWCDRQRLGIEERLRLFQTVCAAVHDAHRHLIVHRDIKPANVLVAPDGEPKLVDFGIAKFLETDEGGSLTAQHVMTPAYASPEQFRGEAVHTATDVYSLGMVLYELLSGRKAFDPKNVAPADIVRLICEDEPPPPSDAVAEGGDDDEARAIADRRRLGPERLRRRLVGDLDTIVMTCLRKEPERRYASVGELSADIERHLKELPLVARRDTVRYRTSKFVRRNRAFVAAISLVLVGLVAVSAVQAAGKRAERREKEKVLRSSDIKRLHVLADQAELLWPAWPGRILDYEDWLRRSEALVARVPTHRAARDELRARAAPLVGDARADAQRKHPSWPALAAVREHLSDHADDRAACGIPADELDDHVRGLRAEEAELDRDTTELAYDFATTEDAWQHDILIELLAEFAAFTTPETGTLDRVRARLAFASTVAERTVSGDDAAARWAAAIVSIADTRECPDYDALVIEPQLGLLPIGRDPASGLWEFVHLQTGAEPERDDAGRLVLTEETGVVFVLLPGGRFWMGAQSESRELPNFDPAARDDEMPVHQVELAPFWMSKYEMTQAQWRRVAHANPSRFYRDGYDGEHAHSDLHPVEMVSWRSAQTMLERLGLTLPTEAQWEFAARAGSRMPWPTGFDHPTLAGSVNLADAKAKRMGMTWIECGVWPELDDGWTMHAPVGTYAPNAFGLHEVSGNVAEICFDNFERYHEAPARSGDGRRGKPGGNPVLRGASFRHTIDRARSAFRYGSQPDYRHATQGFRPAALLPDL